MSSKGEDETEREHQYAHLLQPIRDLAANWSVDVAKELETYLAELSLIPGPEMGRESFNFAEAALLIQGSIQVYSRKVEYLYALVLQALELIAQKKQIQEKKTSIQENGQDMDIVEDIEEDFLNLDDVPEEANIDIVDDESGPSLFTPALKPPACLIVMEEHNIDMSGEAAELATYRISTSRIHRDFLLLDPCDAKFVDDFWKDREAALTNVSVLNPPSSLHGRASRNNIATPNINLSISNSPSCRLFAAEDTENQEAYPSNDVANNFEMPCPNDIDNDDDEVGEHLSNSYNNNEFNGMGGDTEHVEDGGDVDPWAPLNPHEPGTLRVRPIKRGRKSRRKAKKTSEGFFKSLAHNLKQAEGPPSAYEKLRSTFFAHGASEADGWSSDGSSDSQESNERWDAVNEPVDIYEPHVMEEGGFQDPSQGSQDMDHCRVEKIADEALDLQDLCQSHLDSVLKKFGELESEKQSQLATRVTSWKQKIEKHLAVQDSHTPFDIHAYAEFILEKLIPPQNAIGIRAARRPFADIVAGLEKHEVARNFVALLQLANTGNVSVEICLVNAPLCFTPENSFSVRLLSMQRVHEEMLNYRAPSTKYSARKSSQKGKRVLSSPHRSRNTEKTFLFDSNGQVATSISPCEVTPTSNNVDRAELNVLNGRLKKTKSTPEGKRRRRRQSLKAVQVGFAGRNGELGCSCRCFEFILCSSC